MPTNPWVLSQNTRYTDAVPSTRNSQHEYLLLPCTSTIYTEGEKPATRVLLAAAEGEADTDQRENTAHTDDAEEVWEEGDLSLSEIREILKKEQQLIRKVSVIMYLS